MTQKKEQPVYDSSSPIEEEKVLLDKENGGNDTLSPSKEDEILPPSPEHKKKSKFSIAKRMVSGTIAVGLCCVGFYLDSRQGFGWCLAFLVMVAALLSLREFFRFVSRIEWNGIPLNAHPLKAWPYIGAVLLPISAVLDGQGKSADWGFTLNCWDMTLWFSFLLPCIAQLFRKSPDKALVNVGLTILGTVYVVVMTSFLVKIRYLSFPDASYGIGWEYQGVELVLMGVFIAKNADVGALCIGTLWGKHKLIPKLSPKKTWEGAFGGLAFALGLVALALYVQPHLAIGALGLGWALASATVLWAASLAGDLIESAFKRDCQMKDSGTGIPGFGGMLDLIDSLIIAMPVWYLWLKLWGAQ